MKKIEAIIEEYPDMSLMYASGHRMGYDLDDAIIGVDAFNEKLVYSIEKSISIIMDDMISSDLESGDFDEEVCYHTQAIEYFDYNVSGAYVGEHTPIWIETSAIEEQYVSHEEEKDRNYEFVHGMIIASVFWIFVLTLSALLI